MLEATGLLQRVLKCSWTIRDKKCVSNSLNTICNTLDMFFHWFMDKMYENDISEPNLTETHSSELSEVMEKNLIKPTSQAFGLSLFLAGRDLWCTVVKSSLHTHAHTRLWDGEGILDTHPDLLTLTAGSGVACPARKTVAVLICYL